MKRAAAEEDIYHLFRIMLGRRPSPASYIETNKGAPLGDLVRRMAASDEFANKVLKPLRTAEKIPDRPLRDEERSWLKSAGQLPEHYARIVAGAPTQFRAAIALALRAFEGAGGRSAERRKAIAEVLPPLGIEHSDLPERQPDNHERNASNPLISAQDWPVLWALFGGATDSEHAPELGQNVRLKKLAEAVAGQNLLSDELLPSLHRGTSLASWDMFADQTRCAWVEHHSDLQSEFGEPAELVSAWTQLISEQQTNVVTQLLDCLCKQDKDCADAVDQLRRMANVRAGVLRALSGGDLAHAHLLARRAELLDEPNASALAGTVEDALREHMEWSERVILRYLVDRLSKAGGDQVDHNEILEVTPEEARALPADSSGTHVLVRLSDHRLSEGVRSLIGQALSLEPILPICIAEPAQSGPAELLGFQPDPVGLVVRSASDLPDALSLLGQGKLPATFCLPALQAETSPFSTTRDERPIVLCSARSSRPELDAQTIRMSPDQTIATVLEAQIGSDNAPVLISHPGIPMTPEHLATVRSHFARFGEPPVLSFLGLTASLSEYKLSASPLAPGSSQVASLVWLPMSVLSLKAARGLQLSFATACETLVGGQTLMTAGERGGQIAFATGADVDTAKRADRVIKPMVPQWAAALLEHSPPLAPNLPSLSALRAQALNGPAAARLIAAHALDHSDRILAAVERLAAGQLEETVAQEIASHQTIDTLLAVGLHVPFGDALRQLLLRQEEAVFSDEKTLRWAMSAASLAGMSDELAAALARSAPAIIAKHPDLLRPVFEVLAGSLPPDRIAAVMAACIARSPASGTARFRHRVAEISRLFLDGPGARQVFEACGEGPHPQPVQAAFAVALGRDGKAVDWELPPAEALSLAVSNRDANAFEVASRRFAERETPLLDYLDPLRSFAKELAEMDLPDTALPFHRCRDDHEAALLALVIGAVPKLRALRENASDEIDAEISAVVSASLNDRETFLNYVTSIGDDFGLRLGQPNTLSTRWIFEAYASAPSGVSRQRDGRVSVIMSSLETDEDLLKAAVASILAQSHQDLELILIDDGSSRHCREVLAAIGEQDPRVRTYCMPRNLGPYLCRNFALSVASGAFVAIQDADDIAHPDRLALQVAAMQEDPNLQLVTSHHIRVDPRGWPQLEHGFRLLGDGTMTSMFRRRVFETLGPFLPVRSRGDVEMRERIRKWYGSDAIHRINFPLVACHASPQTLSQRTVAAKGNFLKLFRKGIDASRPHPDHLGLEARSQISIPAPLQA